MSITLMAKIVAKSEKVDFVKDILVDLVDKTRNEEGCIGYTLHQDINAPAVFIFYETWESMELLEKHGESEHLKNFRDSTVDALDENEVYMLSILNQK